MTLNLRSSLLTHSIQYIPHTKYHSMLFQQLEYKNVNNAFISGNNTIHETILYTRCWMSIKLQLQKASDQLNLFFLRCLFFVFQDFLELFHHHPQFSFIFILFVLQCGRIVCMHTVCSEYTSFATFLVWHSTVSTYNLLRISTFCRMWRILPTHNSISVIIRLQLKNWRANALVGLQCFILYSEWLMVSHL